MYEIKQGDVLEQLATMPDASVQCCVTSPPYWGLRDYGVEGQIGLEESPAAYVEKMVEVFRGVKRVLRDDGTLWLNVGDSYASDFKGSGLPSPKQDTNAGSRYEARRLDHGLKPKDLCLIPYRLILALQDDGWWVRSQIVWAKKSSMPESVRDRPTSAWEPIFLLTKSQRYYYDAEAVRQSHKTTGEKRERGTEPSMGRANLHGAQQAGVYHPSGANLRNVWHLGPEPFPDAHFATFPMEIPRRAILAGTKKGDTVLDPFAGSGTTLLVAEQLGRDSIGIELNPEYAAMAEKRIQKGLPLTQRKSTEDPKGFSLEMT